MKADGGVEGESESKGSYRKQRGEKASVNRRGSTLGPDGEHDWNTDKGHGYKEGSRTRGQRPGSNLGPDGDHDWNTDKGYKEHDVRRREPGKRYDDNLAPLDGRLEDKTENRERFGRKEGPRRSGRRRRDDDDSLRLDGRLDSATESKDQFYQKEGSRGRRRAGGREDNLKPAGDGDGGAPMDWETMKNREYKEQAVRRMEKPRRSARDNLRRSEGALDDETEHRKQFGRKEGGGRAARRAKSARDGGALGGNGGIEGESETRSKFNSKEGRRGSGTSMRGGEGKRKVAMCSLSLTI